MTTKEEEDRKAEEARQTQEQQLANRQENPIPAPEAATSQEDKEEDKEKIDEKRPVREKMQFQGETGGAFDTYNSFAVDMTKAFGDTKDRIVDTISNAAAAVKKAVVEAFRPPPNTATQQTQLQSAMHSTQKQKSRPEGLAGNNTPQKEEEKRHRQTPGPG